MHVNFATRIAAKGFAESSLSLLTMRNKAFMQQSGHTLFFYIYKNLFYKDVEAGFGQNFKNMLRTYQG